MIRIASAISLLLRLPQVWLLLAAATLAILANYGQPIMDILTYAMWRFAQ